MSDNLFSEDWAVVGAIDPDAYTSASQLTGAIDMATYEQLAAVFILGDRGTGAVLDFKLQSSATSGGSYADISGKAITQITDTSPLANASNNQYVIHLRSGEVTDNNRYVKAVVTDSASPLVAADYSVIVFGKARYRPGSDDDAASVEEIV